MNPWIPESDPQNLRRLGKSVEELGELVKILGRTICQGLDGVDPKTLEVNLFAIQNETADVRAQLQCNEEHWKLDSAALGQRQRQKVHQMAEWESLLESGKSKS